MYWSHNIPLIPMHKYAKSRLVKAQFSVQWSRWAQQHPYAQSDSSLIPDLWNNLPPTCAARCKLAAPRGGTRTQTPGWEQCRPSKNTHSRPRHVVMDTTAATRNPKPHTLKAIKTVAHYRELIVAVIKTELDGAQAWAYLKCRFCAHGDGLLTLLTTDFHTNLWQ